MLDKEQFLLSKLAEEAAEVAVECSLLVGCSKEEIEVHEFDAFYEFLDLLAVTEAFSSNVLKIETLDEKETFKLSVPTIDNMSEQYKIDKLLSMLIKECCCMAKNAMKAQQYGADSDFAGKTNWKYIQEAMARFLLGIIALNELGLLNIIDTVDKEYVRLNFKNKINKINDYLKYAQRLNKVESDFIIEEVEGCSYL